MTAQQADAHNSGDCDIDCEHPDHAFDAELVDMDWLLELSDLLDDLDDDGPVQL